MKIVKQIDETHFEVEMEEYDNNQEITVSVAHDYLAISCPEVFCTAININGKFNAGAANCLSHYRTIQIPIRAAQEILKRLEGHKYLQPEHLLHSDGKPNYLWSNLPIKFKDDKGKWHMVVRGDNETEYSVMSLEAYNSIKK